MRLISFDPGTIHTGYGVLEAGPTYVECGVLDAHASRPRWHRLAELHTEILALIEEHKPTHAALEGGVDQYATAALAGGEIRGIILGALFASGVPPENITEHAPSAVKLAITGKGNAKKDIVGACVKLRLGMKRLPPEDATDALAIGICGVLGIGMTKPRRRPVKAPSCIRK